MNLSGLIIPPTAKFELIDTTRVWTKPSGFGAFLVEMWGAGEGGGYGFADPSLGYYGGGTGGKGGAYFNRLYTSSELPATVAATIGAGGIGGTYPSTAATKGGDTIFNDVTIPGGGYGIVSNTANPSSWSAGSIIMSAGDGTSIYTNSHAAYAVTVNGGGGGGASSGAGFGTGGCSVNGGGGGGMGGSNSISPGTSGGKRSANFKSMIGGGGSSNGGNGLNNGDGGGGGSWGNSSTPGGKGGNGGRFAGGGGGGNSQYGPPGKGGDGGAGLIRVWYW